MPKKRLISDALWARIERLIPPRNNTHPRGGGRKPKDDRVVFEAILFVLRFKCQWSTLSAMGLCPSSTVHDRFKKWRRQEVFERLREAGLLDQEVLRYIDWSWLDGASTHAVRESAPPPAPKPPEPFRDGGEDAAHTVDWGNGVGLSGEGSAID